MITNPDALRAALYITLPHLPVTATCLLGCLLAGVYANRLAAGAVWAVLGFALAALVSVAAPVVGGLVPYWASKNGEGLKQTQTVYAVLGILWTLLSTASFGMLIAGMLAGRPVVVGPPALPPPLPASPGLS